MDLIATLASELNLKPEAVEAAVKLIDEGNTIPFIARYRKEATGGMDDVALRALDERLAYLRNLEQRKADVLLLIKAVKRGPRLLLSGTNLISSKRGGSALACQRLPLKRPPLMAFKTLSKKPKRKDPSIDYPSNKSII